MTSSNSSPHGGRGKSGGLYEKVAGAEDRQSCRSSSKERSTSRQKERTGEGKEIRCQNPRKLEGAGPVWPECCVVGRGVAWKCVTSKGGAG